MSSSALAGHIIHSILAVGAAFLLTMVGYFFFRKRFAWHKLGVEICTIGFAVAVGCVCDFAVFYNVSGIHTIGGVFAQVFHSLFNGFGHLTFNGASDVCEEEVHVAWLCMYYGSCIYTALTFFGVLTAKANYEFYSAIRMMLSCKFRRNIYVFTALNNETLTLAHSMAETDRRDRTRGTLPCLVVFAIPELKPFDRHDELCREVMANGFYYWSYSAELRKKKSYVEKLRYRKGESEEAPIKKYKTPIARCMHIGNHNYSSKSGCKFCVFAFDSEDYIPKEEQNLACVFDDILGRIHSRRIDKLRINYYILTKRQIKHAAYDYKLRELQYQYFLALREVLQSPKKKALLRHFRKTIGAVITQNDFAKVNEDRLKAYILSSRADQKKMGTVCPECKQPINVIYTDIINLFASRFGVDVWDEASTIAKDVLDKSTSLMLEKIYHNEPNVHVLSLGFGETGQAAAMALYSHAAYVNDRLVANDFSVDVYDLYAEKIGYAFAAERPYSYVTIKKDGKYNKLRYLGTIYNELQHLYANVKRPDNGLSLAPNLSTRLNNEMKPPEIVFHCEDCRTLAFLEVLDRDNANSKRPDIVVIATGDDYADVVLANAIIQRVLSRTIYGPPKRIDLFVNVWDKANNDLLVGGGGTWNDSHTILSFRNGNSVIMNVYIVGNNDAIYSYDNTVNITKDAEYNHCYNTTKETVPLDGTLEPKFARALQDPTGKVIAQPTVTIDPADYKQMAEWINSFVAYAQRVNDDKAQQLQSMLEFYALDPWCKESNVMVRHNADFYLQLLQKMGLTSPPINTQLPLGDYKKILNAYAQMCYTEHTRWSRLHMAFGWIYNGDTNKRELMSQHNCILPYADINRFDVPYDLYNVLLAWVFGKDPDKKNTTAPAGRRKKAGSATTKTTSSPTAAPTTTGTKKTKP